MTALADIWSGPTASCRCCTELIADGRSPVGRSDSIHLGVVGHPGRQRTASCVRDPP